ncbi:MAG: hypothetical protein HC880_03830 [Bacteroidia bacterium]|nr:hypothetical protein [Bacteroidia bacterium]
MKKLQEKFSEGDDKFIERLKAPGGRGAGKFDLFKDAETGEIIVKPKKNADLPEPGEPTGYHIDDLD